MQREQGPTNICCPPWETKPRKSGFFRDLFAFLFGGKRGVEIADYSTYKRINEQVRALSSWDLDRYCGDHLSGRLDPETAIVRVIAYNQPIPIQRWDDGAIGFTAEAHIALYEPGNPPATVDGFDIRCQGIIDTAGDLYFSMIEVQDER